MRSAAAIATLLLSAAAPASTAQTLFTEIASNGFFATYEPTTGGVTFHRPRGSVGMRLVSESGTLLPNPTDLDGNVGSVLGWPVSTSAVPFFIEWGQLAGLGFEQSFAGNVVTPNTPPSDLTLEIAINPAQFETLQFLPEPGGLLLAFSAAALLTATRRRSAHQESTP